ncbi:hypothetical protein B0T26DRAFT_670800 [Lasiosphaeria miniovina]|uniref:Uncharacterized protein n=1 Tax=Lasiosphaeria miniovina TaxID=1954250 RepID=A0AA40EC37_9PEZI|nr:uncharacterized protein B0T26DRAFT_670800 [Lasiosphaeria miniovina]KAK0734510.1 hypothetical protein B0T26DRAFT_670800 [Lasiosphaeria miniovina]
MSQQSGAKDAVISHAQAHKAGPDGPMTALETTGRRGDPRASRYGFSSLAGDRRGRGAWGVDVGGRQRKESDTVMRVGELASEQTSQHTQRDFRDGGVKLITLDDFAPGKTARSGQEQLLKVKSGWGLGNKSRGVDKDPSSQGQRPHLVEKEKPNGVGVRLAAGPKLRVGKATRQLVSGKLDENPGWKKALPS